MDDNKLRFGVGVLVIAAIGIGVILTFLFGAFPAILNREYTLTVFFPSAEGINTNTPVLRDGVKIGRVSDIELNDEGGVILTMAVDAEYTMSHRYVPQIGIGSLITGDSKLEFRKAGPDELQVLFKKNPDLIDQLYTDGEYFEHGQKLGDPFTLLFGMEDELRTTFRSIRGAGDAVQEFGGSIQGLVQDVRGVIGLQPGGSSPPPSVNPSPPSTPMRAFPQSGIPTTPAHQMAIAMPPAPDWCIDRKASAIQLVSANSHPNNENMIVQTVAFQNQPGGVTPPVGLNPNLGFPPNSVFDPNARSTFVDLQNQAITTLQQLQAAITEVRTILGDEKIKKGLTDTVVRFPIILDEAGRALQTTQRTMESFGEVGEQFEQVGDVAESAITELKEVAADTLQSFNATAKNVQAITDPIAERSDELVIGVLRSLANVDNALMQLDTFGESLNTSDGTIRRLLEDDQLYDEFRRTLQNVEAATARVRPILDDVRVFTDKIARDPRQLGVRGALGRRPTGAGLK